MDIAVPYPHNKDCITMKIDVTPKVSQYTEKMAVAPPGKDAAQSCKVYWWLIWACKWLIVDSVPEQKRLHILLVPQQGKFGISFNKAGFHNICFYALSLGFISCSQSFQNFICIRLIHIHSHQKCCCRWWFDITHNNREIHGFQPSWAVLLLDSGPVPWF